MIKCNTIEDTITLENADVVAREIRERIGSYPFDLTIRNPMLPRTIIETGLRLKEVRVEGSAIVVESEDHQAGVIELDSSRYVQAPRVSINPLRLLITQFLPHEVVWNILIR